jgi:NAD(P)H-hydrate repair Nnr-like enzyme with NAD(P)H-hydrate dehydratase domain
MTTAATALFLVLLLQIKHFVCDGLLQTKDMVRAKAFYGRPLGILHAAIHGAGTLVVLAAMGFGWGIVLLGAAADFAIHYHIDFTKEKIVQRFGWTTSVPYFWWMIAFDQLMHHLTYLGLAAFALRVF